MSTRTTLTTLRRGVAAVASAALIGIVGIGAIAPETAQAAGVVVEHRTFGSPMPGAIRDEDDS